MRGSISVPTFKKMLGLSGRLGTKGWPTVSKVPPMPKYVPAKYNKYNVAPKEQRTWKGVFNKKQQSILFGSKKEMNRFSELLIEERMGLIRDLKIQVRFELYANIGYIPDFTYHRKYSDVLVAEDSKGVETPVFKLKKKMFKDKYPEIELVIS